MIDSSSGEAAYRQVARMLESWILSGEPSYGPGWVLPPADRLARELGFGVQTVRDAYQLLATMGVVTIHRSYGAQVRTPREREIITVPTGTVVQARMPTFAELDEWGLDPGVPVLVAGDQVWPADRYEIRTTDRTGQ